MGYNMLTGAGNLLNGQDNGIMNINKLNQQGDNAWNEFGRNAWNTFGPTAMGWAANRQANRPLASRQSIYPGMLPTGGSGMGGY
jgi:hypothetical protein